MDLGYWIITGSKKMRTRYGLQLKRKRLGRTNYKKRLKLLLANKPRLVIRKSLKNVLAQVVYYDGGGDKVILSAHSSELKKYGWGGSNNICAAYLVGLLLGNKAKKKNINDLIVDIGLQKSVKGSRIYSVVKGCVDVGMNIPCSEDIFPSEDRIKGKHIKGFDFNKFEEVRKKILGV